MKLHMSYDCAQQSWRAWSDPRSEASKALGVFLPLAPCGCGFEVRAVGSVGFIGP